MRFRPIPWRRMAWVVWRQHRLALAGVVGLLGAAGLYLLITGLQMRDAYAAVAACRPAGSDICRQVANNFLGTFAPGVNVTAGVFQAIPGLIGAFVGAPVLARELETGTFRYAWTQGFGRARWTLAKVVPLAVAVTVAAGVFSLLFSWWYGPITGAGDDNGRIFPAVFDLLGVALAAWTLASFGIGVLAGVLIRRVIPAMFSTVAAWVVLAFVTALFLRPHYFWAPLVTTDPNGGRPGWVISEAWLRGGKPVSLDMMNQTFAAVDIRAVTPELWQPGPLTPASVDPVKYLIQHGYTHSTTYLPDSWFWPFQWIEGCWLLALFVLLIATAVWLVRRRAA